MEPTAAPPIPEKPSFLKGKRLSSGILAGGAALAMTLAGLGIANAQTDDATPPGTTTAPVDGHHDGDHDGGRHHGRCARHAVVAKALGMTAEELKRELEAGKSIADVAKEKGVDLSTVVDAIVADAKARLAERVAAGDLTQDQADAKSAHLTERITDMVNHARPAGGPGDEDHHRGGPKADPAAIASVLNITSGELKAGLESGKSLATLAQEKGVDVAKVIDALVADAKAHLAQAVTDGRLTQAQADERSADLTQRITDFVNHTARPHGGRPGPGHEGDHGPRRANDDADNSGAPPEAQPAVLQA